MQELCRKILDLANADSDIHVFMDELAFQFGAMTTGLIRQLDEAIRSDNYLWVACKKNRSPIHDDNIKS